jgi:predicted transcriptional regulator
VKSAVSIPDAMFAAVDRLARRLRVSRSRVFQLALERFLRESSQGGVTEALDRVYAGKDVGRLDPLLAALQAASVRAEDW